MIPWLKREDDFPAAEQALTEPNGLLAAGADLSPARLIQAYRRGIFPWFSAAQPILWWTPDPRMVLMPAELKISRSLARRLKKPDYEVRFDSAFRQVMEACANTPRPGQAGTWITPDIIHAYCRLHEMGYAHSAETWMADELVGGIYGIGLGRMFYGESMFHHVRDGSKIAFVHLVRRLQQQDYGMLDCQMQTAHLASLGAREIPRKEFSQRLSELVDYPCIYSKWA